MFRAKPVGRLSAVCRPTVGRQSANCRPTVGRQTTNSRPTVGRQLTDSRPTGFLGSSSSQLPTNLSLANEIQDVSALSLQTVCTCNEIC